MQCDTAWSKRWQLLNHIPILDLEIRIALTGSERSQIKNKMKIKPQKNLTNDKKKLTKKKRRVCAMGIRDERIFSTMNLILSPIMLMVLL